MSASILLLFLSGIIIDNFNSRVRPNSKHVDKSATLGCTQEFVGVFSPPVPPVSILILKYEAILS